jgi:transposase
MRQLAAGHQPRLRVACRLHAVLCKLVPGGVTKKITAAHAADLLEAAVPCDAVEAARWELAAEFTEDLRRIDARMHDTKKKLAVAVRASGTSLTDIFGVGPIVAATVIGGREVSRFPNRDHFAAYNGTAPIEVSSGPRKSTGCHGAGTGGSTTPSTWPRSPRSATATARAGPTTTVSWREARPPKRRCEPSSGRSATSFSPASKPTPGGPPRPALRAREGNRGTTPSPAWPAHTPTTGSSAKPLPGPLPPYDPRQPPNG